MGKPREDDQPQDQNLAREQLFSRASRGLLELGQALGIAEPAQVRGAETPREQVTASGQGKRSHSRASYGRGSTSAACGQARRPRPINGSSWSTANDDRWVSGREFGPTAHAPSSLSLALAGYGSDCVSYPRPVKTSRPAGCCGCSRPEAYNRSVGAVYPQSRHLPAKLRAFFGHLVGHFEPGPDR